MCFLLFQATDKIFKDNKILEWVNDLRIKVYSNTNVTYAKVTYKEIDLNDIWIICMYGNNGARLSKVPIGFLKYHYENIGLTDDKPVILFVDDMHFMSEHQNKGYGYKVLQYLINKKCIIQFVVVKVNTRMVHLSEKCGFKVKYTATHVLTMERE
jgi:GNAT superfamily N-acetyltransferase